MQPQMDVEKTQAGILDLLSRLKDPEPRQMQAMRDLASVAGLPPAVVEACDGVLQLLSREEEAELAVGEAKSELKEVRKDKGSAIEALKMTATGAGDLVQMAARGQQIADSAPPGAVSSVTLEHIDGSGEVTRSVTLTPKPKGGKKHAATAEQREHQETMEKLGRAKARADQSRKIIVANAETGEIVGEKRQEAAPPADQYEAGFRARLAGESDEPPEGLVLLDKARFESAWRDADNHIGLGARVFEGGGPLDGIVVPSNIENRALILEARQMGWREAQAKADAKPARKRARGAEITGATAQA